MRYFEIISEQVVGDLKIDPFLVKIDQHAIDQTAKRLVVPQHVDQMLERLGQVKDEIDAMRNGNAFFVVDQSLKISLGIRKENGARLLLKTVINSNKPYHRGVEDILFLQ